MTLEPTGAGGWQLAVLNRGRGMDEETIRTALLPFSSFKPAGTGLGLPLCAEILAAHGGALRLQRRKGGGMAVLCILPGPAGQTSRPAAMAAPVS